MKHNTHIQAVYTYSTIIHIPYTRILSRHRPESGIPVFKPHISFYILRRVSSDLVTVIWSGLLWLDANICSGNPRRAVEKADVMNPRFRRQIMLMICQIMIVVV